MNSTVTGPPSPDPDRGDDEERQVLEAVSVTLDRVRLLLQKRARRRATLISTADEGLAQSARAILSLHGHKIYWVTGGAEAAATAACQRFDLVILDLDTPTQTLESARRIRALPAPHGRAPIAGFVSHLDDALQDAAIESGLDGFVPKPLSPARLVEVAALLTGEPQAGAAAD